MIAKRLFPIALCCAAATPLLAHATYLNVFNIEGESDISADFVTYATLSDMLLDQNRLGVFTPGGVAGENIIGSATDGSTYWNVFNIEGESDVSADFVTYATLDDMLLDQNRLGVFTPGGAAGENIIGSATDGSTYWNVFNIEGESDISADFVTYATLSDMLLDQNRLGVFTPGGVAGENIVGSGSDGSLYWNVFNIEGESDISADFVTYATLSDMLLDQNRLGVFTPGGAAGQNIVGSAAQPAGNNGGDGGNQVPEPGTFMLLIGGVVAALGLRGGKRGHWRMGAHGETLLGMLRRRRARPSPASTAIETSSPVKLLRKSAAGSSPTLAA